MKCLVHRCHSSEGPICPQHWELLSRDLKREWWRMTSNNEFDPPKELRRRIIKYIEYKEKEE